MRNSFEHVRELSFLNDISDTATASYQKAGIEEISGRAIALAT